MFPISLCEAAIRGGGCLDSTPHRLRCEGCCRFETQRDTVLGERAGLGGMDKQRAAVDLAAVCLSPELSVLYRCSAFSRSEIDVYCSSPRHAVCTASHQLVLDVIAEQATTRINVGLVAACRTETDG